jgi:cytosine deaminase
MDRFMKAALAQARKGITEHGIPIGSVLVRNGRIVSRGRNERVQKKDPMRHAEIDCLENAGRRKTFHDCTLYSTLMPCYLCAGAVVQFGIKTVVVGESKTFKGARKFLESHGVKVVDLGLAECAEMMAGFIAKNPSLWAEDIGK